MASSMRATSGTVRAMGARHADHDVGLQVAPVPEIERGDHAAGGAEADEPAEGGGAADGAKEVAAQGQPDLPAKHGT